MENLEPWQQYRQTAKHVWESEDDAYSRTVSVTQVVWDCMVCKQRTKVLDVDTSDGEYLSFACCLPCFTKLINTEQQNGTTS